MSGNTNSCGCYREERVIESTRKHGMACTKLGHVWSHMNQRCSNPNDKNYKNYGARGIKVCDDWKVDFQAFYDHVSKLPHFGQPGYSIDRIDNDGNYEPGNVKWSTALEQNNNRRKTVKLTFDGQTHTLKEWAEITSISLCAIQHRYYAGKPVEEILRR